MGGKRRWEREREREKGGRQCIEGKRRITWRRKEYEEDGRKEKRERKDGGKGGKESKG